MFEIDWRSDSHEATQALGEALGALVVAPQVVALEGELGAGKTCFVQGLARGLGVAPDKRIGSPTFTIVNVHSGRHTLYHVDLYRISAVSDLGEIGFGEMLEAEAVAVVEWFDKMPSFKPSDRLQIQFSAVGENSRALHAVAIGPRSAVLLEAWKRAVGG